MKSMQQIVDDMTKYFSEVNAEGIDGADYVDASFMQTEDEDGRRDTLYIVFFKGEERVCAWHFNLATGEGLDMT